MEQNVAIWYKQNYPDDIDMFDDINPNINFTHVLKYMLVGDFYNDVCGDSVVRERIFEHLSIILNLDYDVIYNLWS
jgi:hypothetical protein